MAPLVHSGEFSGSGMNSEIKAHASDFSESGKLLVGPIFLCIFNYICNLSISFSECKSLGGLFHLHHVTITISLVLEKSL